MAKISSHNDLVVNSRLHSYLKSGQRFVSGWLRPGAADSVILLSALQRRNQVSGGVAEIGVHHGKLFIVLYLLCSDAEPAVAIDLFSMQHLNVEHSGAGDLEIFKRNLSRFADTTRLVVHEGDSTLLTPSSLCKLGNGPFRLISIDGGHTPEVTAHDLGTAEGALADGGIIILDDCFNEAFPGVAEGVFRFFSQPRSIAPFAVGAGKTFFCDPRYASQYADALRAIPTKSSERSFLGRDVLCLEFGPLTLAEKIGKIQAWRSVKNLPPARLMRRAYHSIRPHFHN
jgi:hypothetical protein